MRSLSTVSTLPVCLAVLVAISLLSVGQSASAEETAAKETPDKTTTKSTTEPPRPLRLWADDLDPERTEQILDILDSDLTSQGLDFEDEPLEGVIAFLREEYSLQIQLDSVGLDDLGIGPDEPVTISIHNVKMAAALRLMLEPMEMEYIVQDGILLITSEDAALTKLSVAVYPVGDILNEKPDWDALIDTILSTVESDSWAEHAGGEAEIRPYPQRTALVILQTTQIHEKIAALLTALRECETNPNAIPYPLSGRGAERGGNGGGRSGGGGGGGGQF